MTAKRQFIKTLGAAGVLLAAQRLLASTPAKPSAADRRVTPQQYGARADGLTDDTKAIIEAARAADRLQAWLSFPEGTYLLSDQVNISGNIAGVVGEGGVIRMKSEERRVGLLFRNLTRPDPIGQPLLVTGLQIVCDVRFANQAAVLYGIDIEGVHFTDNQIRNVQVGAGVYLRGTHNRVENGRTIAVANNVLKNNVIEVRPLPDHDCFGIQIEAERLYTTKEHSAKEVWLKYFVLPQVPVPATANVLEGNKISGGYYGISFLGCTRSLVRNNVLTGQIRSMSIQHLSNANLVIGNQAIDSLSASLHFAYGASYNVITENVIKNNRGRGEGLMQAYVGASHNDFFGNDIEVGPKGHPKYHCYTGVAANENSFWGNRMSGPAARAYIAIESAFNSKSKRKSARNYGLKGKDDNFTDRGMYGVRVIGNEIKATSDVPVFVLAQEGDDRGEYPLLMCELGGNTVHWPGKGVLLEMSERRVGALRNIVMTGNVMSPVPTRKQLVLPRGGAHFSDRIDKQNTPEMPDV